jgi:uncharacterized ferritin-like protein (DUF455 family)
MIRACTINPQTAWKPFLIKERGDTIRPLNGPEGVADRLRLVAFAEVQARDAFFWGAEHFAGQIPEDWRSTWIRFAEVEERHANLLLQRLVDIGGDVGARAVSDKLSRLCRAAEDPIHFLFLLSSAEERGMESGLLLGKQMESVDAISAKIFQQIAEEEVEHVEAANIALAPFNKEELKAQARLINAKISP